METMLTTKQVADMLGLTQQAAYRRLRYHGCTPVMGRARDNAGAVVGISHACWWTAGDLERVRTDRRKKKSHQVEQPEPSNG